MASPSTTTRTILLLCGIALFAFIATQPVEARGYKWRSPWVAPYKKQGRCRPILECVMVSFPTYTAYFGYENFDTTTVNITYGSDDNKITGFGLDFSKKCPSVFKLPNKVPGRPGRSLPYPNNEFTVTLPYLSIGFWFLGGRILIISQWGPKCNQPDRTPPVFKIPKQCPVKITLSSDEDSDDATFTQCFEATDNDNQGNIMYVSSGFDSADNTGNCFDKVGLKGFGLHTGAMTAIDQSDNKQVCDVYVTVVDTQKPDVDCKALVTGSITDPVATTYTFAAGLLTADALDNNPAILAPTVKFSVSGDTQVSTTEGEDAAGDYNFGTSKITWSATDLDRNTGYCFTTVKVVDAAPPVLTCPASQTVAPGKNGKASVPMKATATDALSNFRLKVVRTFGRDSSTQTEDGKPGKSVSLDPSQSNCNRRNAADSPYPTGVTTLVFSAVDSQGNEAVSCTVTVTVEVPSTRPTVNCPASQDVSTNSGVDYATISPLKATLASGSVDATITSEITNPDSSVSTGTDDFGTYQFKVGTTKVKVTATPTSGSTALTSSCAFDVVVSDKEEPVLVCPVLSFSAVTSTDSDKLLAADLAAALPDLTATATDNVRVTVSYVINNDANTKTSTGPAQQVTSTVSGVNFGLGNTTVKWTAVDDAANPAANECTSTVTITDGQAPTIKCAEAYSKVTEIGATYAMVSSTDTQTESKDNVGVVSVTNDYNDQGDNAAGNYPIGEYTITFTAKDATGKSATCTQTITITQRNYCADLTCYNSGVCTPSPATGTATSAYCDCTLAGCYSTKADGTMSATCQGSPFPVGGTTRYEQTVSFCAGASVTADTSCATSTPGVSRRWVFASASDANGNSLPDSEVTKINTILDTLGSGATLSFSSTDLVGGFTYHISLVYSDSASGTSYTVDYQFEKTAGNGPTVSDIDGPGTFQIGGTNQVTTVPLTATVGADQCTGGALTNPTYKWTLSANSPNQPLHGVETWTGASGLVLSIPVADLSVGTFEFKFEVTDGLTGLKGSLVETLVVTQQGGGNPDPCTRTLANPTLPANSFVKLIRIRTSTGAVTTNNIVQPSVPTAQTLDNQRFTIQFDAGAFVDPYACNNEPLSFSWFISTISVPGDYRVNGITGYDKSLLNIEPNSLIGGNTIFTFRLVVTSTATPTTPTRSTTYLIQASVASSQLDITIFNNCQDGAQGTSCTISAALPPGVTQENNGFAVQGSSEWTWTWMSVPYLNLTNYGQGTSQITIPTEGVIPGTLYTFQVTVTNGIESASTTTTIYYYSSAPTSADPSKFVVLPPSGTALSQRFVLECRGWSAGSALSYAFKYLPEGKTDPADEISLTTLGWSPTSSVLLPAGKHRIVAYIYAQDGAFTRMVSPTTIDVAEAPAENRGCWTLEIVSTLLANAEAQQANSLSLTLVFYLSDYLNDPALKVSSLVCNGVDQTAALKSLSERFLAILERVMSSTTLDSTQSAMVSSAILKITSSGSTTTTDSENAAKLVTSLVGNMNTGGASGSTLAQTQSNVLNLVSRLISHITDCTVLESLDLSVRGMFAQTLSAGTPGTASVSLESGNVQMTARSVWANHAQTASLGETMFNLPIGALTSSTDTALNVMMLNYIEPGVKKCRAVDAVHQPVSVISDIFQIEVVSPSSGQVQAVSGLSTPITFTMPVVADTATGGCGVGQGPYSCAWWNEDRKGWSTAGCTTVGAPIRLESGLVGIQCACNHLTEFAIVRSTTQCLDAPHTYGFRVMVFIYGMLLAIAGGLFFRTVCHTKFDLRENMMFTIMICLACVIRMVCATHYSQYFSLPTGLVDVLMVIPFSILYWINGHFFKNVRIQRHQSTETRVKWKVEPVLKLVQGGVFLGMLVLLSGLGLNTESQAQLAVITVRAIAITFLVANAIFFGYSGAIVLGLTAGRSEVALTRSLIVMSCACVCEMCFWGAWPVSGNSLFPCCGFDLVAIGVLLYKYRDPIGDKRRSSARASQMATAGLTDGRPTSSELDTPLASPSSTTKRPSEFSLDSPRRPSTQLPTPIETTTA